MVSVTEQLIKSSLVQLLLSKNLKNKFIMLMSDATVASDELWSSIMMSPMIRLIWGLP